MSPTAAPTSGTARTRSSTLAGIVGVAPAVWLDTVNGVFAETTASVPR